MNNRAKSRDIVVDISGKGDWSFTTSSPADQSLNQITQDLKRSLINEALRRSRGRRQAAARLLKISRDSLKHYVKTLGYSEGE